MAQKWQNQCHTNQNQDLPKQISMEKKNHTKINQEDKFKQKTPTNIEIIFDPMEYGINNEYERDMYIYGLNVIFSCLETFL